MTMRVGASPYGSDRASTTAFSDAVVAAGIDTLWLGDGIFKRPDFAEWRGHLTDGRFVLAVAAGFWDDELSYRGVEPARRGRELRQRLDALRDRFGAAGHLSPAPRTPGGPPIWLAGGPPTMRLALTLGLPFQASRALPDELAPIAARWFAGGGGLLAHRIYVEAGDAVPDGQQVQRHVLSGSAAALADGLGRFREMGVGDISLVLGHDDASARQTLDVLAADVLPQL